MTTTAPRLWRTLVRVGVNRLGHKPPSRLESGALTPQAALRNKTGSPETLWVIILPISSNGLLCSTPQKIPVTRYRNHQHRTQPPQPQPRFRSLLRFLPCVVFTSVGRFVMYLCDSCYLLHCSINVAKNKRFYGTLGCHAPRRTTVSIPPRRYGVSSWNSRQSHRSANCRISTPPRRLPPRLLLIPTHFSPCGLLCFPVRRHKKGIRA